MLTSACRTRPAARWRWRRWVRSASRSRSRLKAYPHQLSGGMRRARRHCHRAAATGPRSSSPTSPRLRSTCPCRRRSSTRCASWCATSGTAVIWINAHLATVSSLADDILVMYAGRVVEAGRRAPSCAIRAIPIRRGSSTAVPSAQYARRDLPQILLDALAAEPAARLPFAPRCHARTAACEVMPPTSFDGGRSFRCHNPGGSRHERAILELDDVSKRFDPRLTMGDRIAARPWRRRGDAQRAGGSRRQPRAFQGRDPGPRRRIRLRQVHAGADRGGHHAADLRLRPPRRQVRDGRVLAPKLTHAHPDVFQDPFASLNPRIKVGETISEGPSRNGLRSRREGHRLRGGMARPRGLDPSYAQRYPHQFSGGQRQRIAIARALA